MDYLLFLDEIPEGKQALSLVGGKAYNLARLRQAGFSVPPGFCLTAAAYRRFWEENHLQKIKEMTEGADNKEFEDKLLCEIEKIKFPEDLAREIREAHKLLTEESQNEVAVRSSSLLEDGESASFAGQYDTFLNICDVDELEAGIKKVWASLWFRRADAYSSQLVGKDRDTELPVIVQQMVFPEFSGAAFSINPIDGVEEIVVEAVPGLGDVLVGGYQTPDRYHLDKETLLLSDSSLNEKGIAGLPEEVLKTVSELVLKVEYFFGCPQDVEWAVREGQIYLLQSRPVTALPQRTELVSKGQVDMEALLKLSEETGSEIWTDDNVGEVFPEAVTPLSWSILEPLGNQAFRKFLTRMGIKAYPAAGLFGRFYGRVYFNQSQFQQLMNRFYPSRLNRKRGRFLGLFKAALALANSAVRTLFWLPILPVTSKRLVKRTISEIQDLPVPEKLGVNDLIEEIEHLRKKEERLMGDHLAVTIFASLLYSLLDKVVPVWSKGGMDTATLTTGLPGMKSAEMGEDLASLAAEAIQDPAILTCLEEAAPEDLYYCLEKLSKSGSLWSSYTSFINKHGHASPQEFELACPRWRDQPKQVLGMLKVHLQDLQSGGVIAVPEKQKQIRLQAEQEMGRSLGYSIKRILFQVLLKLVQSYSVERENLKYVFVMAHGQVRGVYLSIADKLVQSGQLFDPEDIFFLTHKEVASLQMAEISPGEASVRAGARREEYKTQTDMRENPPRLLEQKPDGTWQPLIGTEIYKAGENDKARTLQGVAASAGLFTGRARVIIDPEDSAELQSGEILVARSTNPAWSPLFLSAGALVTEIGGLLSHGAIVAREYGLPAVLNVKGITAVVKTGQTLTVDGYRGIVHILDKNGHE